MSTSQPARQPAGSPASAGGEFAPTNRTEPHLTLAADHDPQTSAAVRDADAMLDASLLEGAALSGRIERAHGAVLHAWRQAVLYGERRHGAQVRLWEQSAHRAEEDLCDLRVLYAGTAPGLGALQRELDEHTRPADAARRSPAIQVAMTEDGYRARAAATQAELTDAARDAGMTPVGGGPDMAGAMQDRWAAVSMVAVPLEDPGTAQATGYRILFTTVDGELARLTWATRGWHGPDARALDKTTIAGWVQVLSRSNEPGSGDARDLLADLDA